MGMIMPIWQEPEEELPHPLTRITLFLHEGHDAAELERERQTAHQQFHELQDTLLLFLRKIRRIEVFFYEQDQQTSATIFSMEDTRNANRVVLERTSATGPTSNGAVRRRQVYHVTKHVAKKLARNENRSLSLAEEDSSEIVLAFPLTDESVPIIAPQEVFAFLPVRQMGFNVSESSPVIVNCQR